MAFYFALFNVSNVNQQLRGQAHKRERRRHSLATSSHVAKDYRLLPRPKIIFHDTNTDNETVSTLLDETTEDDISSSQNSFKYLNTPHKDSLKYRRASSPEHRRHAMDIAFNEPFTIAEIERHLRRVKFSSPTARSVSKDNETSASSNVKENQEDEQVWVKRTLSPTNHVTREDWVYSIDLESKKLNERANRPPLPERQRPTMGVSALELRSSSVERNRLRDDLRRHVNTWPEIRANRARWRPSLLLRRHSGGNLNENDRLTSMFQKRRGSGGNSNNSQIPYQSITPTSPPQDPIPNEPQPSSSTQKPYNQLPPKPQKSIVVITPTNRQPRQNTVGQFRSNLNSWAQNAMCRGRNSDTNVPFVRLNNDGGRDMIRSSVF